MLRDCDSGLLLRDEGDHGAEAEDEVGVVVPVEAGGGGHRLGEVCRRDFLGDDGRSGLAALARVQLVEAALQGLLAGDGSPGGV